VIEAFRKNEAYCREQAENSLLPEKWHQMANEWAALAEKLESPHQGPGDGNNQNGHSEGGGTRDGTLG